MPKTSATISNTTALLSEQNEIAVSPAKKQRKAKAENQNGEISSTKRGAKTGLEKITQLLKFDADTGGKWTKKNNAIYVGTDEVGRGCLAGPVVAAVVQLDSFKPDSELALSLSALNDSKKLSASKREELCEILKANCFYAIGEASVEEINEINILQASFLAMRRAMAQMNLPETTVVLVDGNQKISHCTLRQILVIGGDGISASIAAASIIAKVHRDKLMCNLHEEFPHYSWNSNKGYGSKDHRDALIEHGLTSWHRPGFCAKIMQANSEDDVSSKD